jgi:hypothetical protein
MNLRGFLLLAFADLLAVCAFTFVTPLGDAPDEGPHLVYLQHMMDTGERPPRQWLTETPYTYEAHQHPLYYLTSARILASNGIPSIRWVQEQQGGFGQAQTPALRSFPVWGAGAWNSEVRAIFAARATTWIWSLLAVLALWLIAQKMTSRSEVAALAVVPFALCPQFLYLGSVVNNDISAIALVSLAVAGMIAATKSRCSGWQKSAWVLVAGFSAAAALWAKITAVVVFAPLLLTCHALWSQRSRLLAGVLLTIVVGSCVAGLVAIGMGDDAVVPSFAVVEHTHGIFAQLGRLLTEPFWIVQLWASFWGLFGYFTYNLPLWLLLLWVPVSLATAFGFFLLCARVRYDHSARILAALVLANVGLWLGVMTEVSWQPQGRYFFPSLAALVGALAVALDSYLPELRGKWRFAAFAPWPIAAFLSIILWGLHSGSFG